MNISVQHIDTCLPCYVLDHCNGDNELLLGVIVDRSTRYYQVRDDLISELHAQYGGRLAESCESAIREAFKGINLLKVFDSTLDSAKEYDSGEYCYAWFRLSWSEETAE